MNTAIKRIYNEGHLKNTDQVLVSLQLLEHDLPRLGLEHLISFNHVYIIITQKVRQTTRKDLFISKEFLNTFDARFAYYYTQALRQFLQNKTCPPAWKIAFNEASKQESSPLVVMALGVNAHVNNDIPQVLLDCEATKNHLEDFNAVNGLIESGIDQVLDELPDSPRTLDPKNALLKPTFKLAMKKIIKVWRKDAWNKFEDLRDNHISIKTIEKNALNNAKQLLKLPV